MAVKQEKVRLSEKAQPASPVALRRIRFGAIPRQRSDSRTPCPVLPDGQGQHAAIAARILERSAQVKAWAGALELEKA